MCPPSLPEPVTLHKTRGSISGVTDAEAEVISPHKDHQQPFLLRTKSLLHSSSWSRPMDLVQFGIKERG